MNPLPDSLQAPPFSHGAEAHSSMSTSQSAARRNQHGEEGGELADGVGSRAGAPLVHASSACGNMDGRESCKTCCGIDRTVATEASVALAPMRS